MWVTFCLGLTYNGEDHITDMMLELLIVRYQAAKDKVTSVLFKKHVLFDSEISKITLMDESNLFFRNLVCLLKRETEHNTTQKILNTRQKLTPTNEKNSNVSA